MLIFAQQFAFGGFENLFSLFSLNRLGLNASGNAIIFVILGLITTIVQGGLVGIWSRKYGDRWLIYLGLATLAAGLILTSLTPNQPVPWYSRQAMMAELTAHSTASAQSGQVSSSSNIQIALPDDSHTGLVGLAWIIVMLLPVTVGGAILSPTINSAITKRVTPSEIGGMLGMSTAFVSAANALAPVIGGAVFQALGSTAPFLGGGILVAILWVIAQRAIKPQPASTVSVGNQAAEGAPAH